VVLWGFLRKSGGFLPSDKVWCEVNMVEDMTVEGDGPVAEDARPGKNVPE